MSVDPNKEATNIQEHGVSLTFGSRVIADPYSIEILDDRIDYGEERWWVIGMVEGNVWSAIYTDRDDGPRFISVYPADKKATDRYWRNRNGG